VTLYPGDCSDPDQLLRHADQAMYQAKTAGKNQFRFYDPTAIEPGSARGALARIRQALLDGEFEIQYQPKVNWSRVPRP
jgi:predicted signal transduction protein with EAL and GGDEF domain